MEEQLKKLKVISFSQFPPSKLREVKKFISKCKKQDGYEPVFYWGIIKNRKNASINELLCYTEKKEIIGYVALYHFEENEIEITLMTDPSYRHPLVYEALLAHIKRIVSSYPVEVNGYLFTCNQETWFLKEYLNGLGAECSRFTHKLALTSRGFAAFELKNKITEEFHLLPLHFRKATTADLMALVRLEVDCFQVPAEIYKKELLQTLADPKKEILVAIKNKEIIGKIHVQLEQKNAHLYDLCVATHEQGQGYGAFLLWDVLRGLFVQEVKTVFVEVEDAVHVNWYKSFHFVHKATYEHWRLSIQKTPFKEREKQLENLLLNFHCHQVQDQLAHSLYKH